MSQKRTLSWDWYPGTIPDNVLVDETAYIETTYSFQRYRSEQPVGLRIGRGASVYLGVMFDVGRRGQIRIGDYALINGAWMTCDAAIDIGDYALISWNVVIMDCDRLPRDPVERRRRLQGLPRRSPRVFEGDGVGQPVHIGRNTWVGFDTCILPGVTIGEGSIIGARSVVTGDIPPYCVAGGNPARVIRQLDSEEAASYAR